MGWRWNRWPGHWYGLGCGWWSRWSVHQKAGHYLGRKLEYDCGGCGHDLPGRHGYKRYRFNLQHDRRRSQGWSGWSERHGSHGSGWSRVNYRRCRRRGSGRWYGGHGCFVDPIGWWWSGRIFRKYGGRRFRSYGSDGNRSGYERWKWRHRSQHSQHWRYRSRWFGWSLKLRNRPTRW